MEQFCQLTTNKKNGFNYDLGPKKSVNEKLSSAIITLVFHSHILLKFPVLFTVKLCSWSVSFMCTCCKDILINKIWESCRDLLSQEKQQTMQTRPKHSATVSEWLRQAMNSLILWNPTVQICCKLFSSLRLYKDYLRRYIYIKSVK